MAIASWPTATTIGLVRRLTLAVAVAAASLVPSSARAHEAVPVGAGGAYRSVLLVVPDGVKATLLAGTIPAIALTTQRAVVILGEEGEEMARVSGASIEVNDASDTWRVTAESRGDPPGDAWRPLRDALFTWLEPRAKPLDGQRTARQWRVPITVDGRRVAITGETRWFEAAEHAADDGGSSPVSPYAAGGIVAAVVALAALQRRRGSRKGGLSSRES